MPNGARHSGHSGFWLCQAAMQAQQKTCPQGTAVGTSRAPRHSAQRRFCGTSAHSAPAPSAAGAAVSASLPSSCSKTGSLVESVRDEQSARQHHFSSKCLPSARQSTPFGQGPRGTAQKGHRPGTGRHLLGHAAPILAALCRRGNAHKGWIVVEKGDNYLGTQHPPSQL